MTRAERPDDSPARPPKPSWGPGKNAALSIVAFAAIFGLFAYAERDSVVGHASIAHDISRVITTAVGNYRKAIVAATSRATGASGATVAAAPASTIAQPGTPTVPTPEPSASTVREVSTVPPVSVAVAGEPQAAPRTTPRGVAKYRQPSHAAPVTLAANTHAAPASGRAVARHGAAHHAPRTETLAGTRKRLDYAPKPRSYGTDTAHMQTASVTHAELEGARALAKARSCAQIDEWNCVEQNASRALAIDPKNSESRALLGQAIRNRL